MNRTKLIRHVHETVRDEISRYGIEAWDLLTDWTAEHASSTIGAAPSTAPRRVLDNNGDPIDPTEPMSRLESAALHTDQARKRKTRFAQLLVELVVVCEQITASVNLPLHPDRAARLRIRHGLAFIASTVWRLRVDSSTLAAANDHHLERLARLTNQLGAVCVANHRPPRPARIACLAHAEAGLDVDVAPRYSTLRLCRWCGEFRALHGRTPPRELVRLHDRGVRITRDLLRNAGIRESA